MLPTKRIRIKMTRLEESSTQESSGHIIASNDDLLTEVLLRLPIKSLIKLKSVSKHWLSLITHPHFSHLKNPDPNPVSALFLRIPSFSNPNFAFVPLDPLQTSAPFTSLTFVDHPRGIQILQSCNGLICCSSVEYSESERKYYIYNPTTKQFTTLPPLSGGTVRPVLGVILAFDPSKSQHYKVVCVQRCESSHDHCRIQIYSSETGPWRVSGAPFTGPADINFHNGVHWNGAIHWISPTESALYFDLNQELVRELPMPPHLDGNHDRTIRYLGESRGHLHLVFNHGSTLFDVYEMEGDRSAWFVKFRVDLDVLAVAFPDIMESYFDPYDLYYFSFSVLCVVRGEKEEDSLMVVHIPGKVIGYNLNSKTYQEICDTEPSLRFDWVDAFQYIESLCFV